MELFYKIEVNPEPNYNEPSSKPYFWRIASINRSNPDSQYCTVTAGWAATAQEAFTEAYNYYCKYICTQSAENTERASLCS